MRLGAFSQKRTLFSPLSRKKKCDRPTSVCHTFFHIHIHIQMKTEKVMNMKSEYYRLQVQSNPEGPHTSYFREINEKRSLTPFFKPSAGISLEFYCSEH